MKKIDNKDIESFKSAALAINEAVDNSIKTIPEAVFVAKLLPIMQEWVVEGKGDNVIAWIEAAGGTERPMMVTLSDGEYFMVPPPYNQTASINARDDRENNQIHAMTEMSVVKMLDGESRESLKLDSQITSILTKEEDIETLYKYTVQLAKIWDRYNLPVEQVLGTLNLDLDMYDVNGLYIGGNNNPNLSKSGVDDGDDELQF